MSHKPLSFLLGQLHGPSCLEQEWIQDRATRSKTKGLSVELNKEIWWTCTCLPLEYLLSGLSSGLLMDTGCCCVLRSLLDLQYRIPASLLFRLWGIFIKFSVPIVLFGLQHKSSSQPVMQRQGRHWSKRPMTYLFYKTYSPNKGARFSLLIPLYRRNRVTGIMQQVQVCGFIEYEF